MAGLNSRCSVLVPAGEFAAVTSDCTPNSSVSEPDITRNFSGSISENDNISTKNDIRSTMRSANVINHGGEPLRNSGRSAGASMRRSGCPLLVGAPALRQVVFQQVL